MKSKLLLLHGALGSVKQFEALIPLLNSDFEIITLNFEGHDGLISNNDFSIQLFTQNVIGLLDTKGINSVNIFGYSMGGYVALNSALEYPNRINKIVTLGTKFEWSPESALKEIKMLNPEKIEEKIPQFAEKLKKEHSSENWKEVVNKTSQLMKGLSEGKAITNDDFKKINHEVTIGIGKLDTMVSIKESEMVCNFLPNGKIAILEGVPHPIDKIDAQQLAKFIRESFF